MNFKVMLTIEYAEQNNQEDETSAGVSSVRLHVDWCGRFPKNSPSTVLSSGSSGLQVRMPRLWRVRVWMYGCRFSTGVVGCIDF